MKDTMILKDGTTVELEVGASLAAIQVAAADRTAMLQIWQNRGEPGRGTDQERKRADGWNVYRSYAGI